MIQGGTDDEQLFAAAAAWLSYASRVSDSAQVSVAALLTALQMLAHKSCTQMLASYCVHQFLSQETSQTT
jgi:hypothetical protein